jgi:uncharacterized protein (DUF305 family)
MLKRSLLLSVLTLTLAVLGFSAVMADGPVEGRPGRAEMRFLEGMIDHHQMAVDMATDCLAKATTESVRTTCQNIIDAQTAEIATMQEWLTNWYNVSYAPMPMADMMAMMEGNMGMEGMDHNMEGMATADPAMPMPMTDPAMMMGMMAGLNHLEGIEYEIAWVESMIDHHDDAIHMAERILARDPEGTGHAELREMAQKIITDQTAEIEHMETMLTELAG